MSTSVIRNGENISIPSRLLLQDYLFTSDDPHSALRASVSHLHLSGWRWLELMKGKCCRLRESTCKRVSPGSLSAARFTPRAYRIKCTIPTLFLFIYFFFFILTVEIKSYTTLQELSRSRVSAPTCGTFFWDSCILLHLSITHANARPPTLTLSAQTWTRKERSSD